ncbi:MAG: rhomboid family intramembrane serine protease [Cyanobacteriota bacterium]|nr:rhomboid family intramembrane serine protease [Cyanobacteriota bacterium]
MGQGRAIGELVLRWQLNGDLEGLDGQQLGNRLLDAAGDDQRLRGALRDLGQHPLFRQLLQARSEAQRRTMLHNLSGHLAEVYNPAILAELDDLLGVVTGLQAARPAPEPVSAETWLHAMPRRRSLRLLAPGLGLGAGGALMVAWLGEELERVWLADWGWRGGGVLVLALAVLQLARQAPCGRRLDQALLSRSSAVRRPVAWRWLTAPWLHQRDGEAWLNLALLALVLGSSPLPLRDVLLRYLLSSVAALGLAIGSARALGVGQRWGGASGAVAALISLAAGLSLLRRESLGFNLGPLQVPAWVLIGSYAIVQLAWIRPRQRGRPTKPLRHWVAASTWLWGTAMGALWALVTWISGLLG